MDAPARAHAAAAHNRLHGRGVARPTAPSRGGARCRASVGIDLGTSNSAVACVKDGRPVVIAAEDGASLLPSVVRYTPSGVVVGREAQDAASRDPLNTFYCVKRIIGRPYADVQELAKGLSYGLTRGPDDMAHLACGVPGLEAIAPEQASAEIIKVLKRRAEAYLGETVDRAVITVPAHFGNDQRLATMSAAISAGIERVSLLQEPVAAAMAYGLGKKHDEQPAILVFDLGGGTFDISLLQSFEGIMEVVGSEGDNQLGGYDLDRAVADLICKRALPNDVTERVLQDPASRQRLQRAAEACKVHLSSSSTCDVTIDDLAGGSAVRLTVSSADLELAAGPFLERLWAPVDALGTEFKIAYAWRPDNSSPSLVRTVDRFAPPPRKLSQLVLVGGVTKSPMVSDYVERIAGIPACKGVDPELCVAIGAAIQAGIMEGSLSEDLEMMDSLYVKSLQGRVSGFQS